MSGSDDDDYWVPPGTKVVMSYGPDGPSPQPVALTMCTRPTRECCPAELERTLAAERAIYRSSMTAPGSIPSLLERRTPDASAYQAVIELTLDDIIQEDE